MAPTRRTPAEEESTPIIPRGRVCGAQQLLEESDTMFPKPMISGGAVDRAGCCSAADRSVTRVHSQLARPREQTVEPKREIGELLRPVVGVRSGGDTDLCITQSRRLPR